MSATIQEEEDIESSLPGQEEIKKLETSKSSNEPYSVFSKWQKIVIVGIASVAGLLSPLSANTYFPALPAIEKVSKKKKQLCNETQV